MPVIVEQTFLLGRFHATRWNQNPFEDRYGEWPPSPWRLLRALAARWFQYQRETGDDNVDVRDALLRALASELPAFRLPTLTWRGQELRQYHPTALELQYKYKKNLKTKKSELEYSFRQVSTTLVVDTYQAVAHRDRVVWMWRQLRLPPEQRDLLDQLLRRIRYFGRAESLTSMRLVQQTAETVIPNCMLRHEAASTSVPVLVPRPDHELDIDLLLAITDDKRLSNTPIPMGTAWYHADLPAVPRQKAAHRLPQSPPRPQIVRFALDSTVLPLVTETLPVAEATRRALMSCHGRITEQNGRRGRSDTLSGKDAAGAPLIGHIHAYYLPTDEDGDGRADHITIVARDGFEAAEMRAMDRLRLIRPRGRDNDSHPLRVLLLGFGQLGEYTPPPLGPSREWVSATPYIATRYAKTRGRDRINLASSQARADFLLADLREQIRVVLADLDADVVDRIQITPEQDDHGVFRLPGCYEHREMRPIQFKRFRSKSGDDGGRRLAGAFRIVFPTPVRGPIALGWSSHFGMGLFVPEDRTL